MLVSFNNIQLNMYYSRTDGKSNGAPCEENCYADIEAAYAYLLGQSR